MTALLIARLLDTSAFYFGFTGVEENTSALAYCAALCVNGGNDPAIMTPPVSGITDRFHATARE